VIHRFGLGAHIASFAGEVVIAGYKTRTLRLASVSGDDHVNEGRIPDEDNLRKYSAEIKNRRY
jgi:hypothetical protein